MEGLNKLLEHVRTLSLIKGITVEKEKKIELIHLFFADDILLFCQLEANSLLNLRCILLFFQAVSELRIINMGKFEPVDMDLNSEVESLARVLNCKISQLPIKYLVVPLGANYKDGINWEPIIELFERRLASWKKIFLSKGGRLTLIKSTISNLITFFLFSPSRQKWLKGSR